MIATHLKARRCFLIGRSMRSYLDGAARSWYVSGIVLRPQLIGPTDTCACADCRFMKKNTLEKLRDALANLAPEILLPEAIRRRAELPIIRMLDLSR